MTDEVAGLVLRNNYLQSQAISTGEFRAKERLSESAYVIRSLERSGDLNRALEFLPSDEEIAERRKAGEGLTRPELAITLSYGKIWLYKALIHSDVPEDPYLSAELARYFPEPVQKRFASRIKRHRLPPRDHLHRHHEQPHQPHGPRVPGCARKTTPALRPPPSRGLHHRARSLCRARPVDANRSAR